MVLKKDLLKELKSSNKELEKHLLKLNLESFPNELIKNSLDSSENNQILNLLSTGIIDLRTEVSLLRKNLSVDIENMVLRQVNESQQRFFDDMNTFHTKIVIEMKKNFANYIGELGLEFNKLKLEVVSLKSKNDTSTESLTSIKSEILDFKFEVMENLNSLEKPNQKFDEIANYFLSNKKMNEKLDSKIDLIGKKFIEISDNISKKNNFFDNKLKIIDKRLISKENVKAPKVFKKKIVKQIVQKQNKSPSTFIEEENNVEKILNIDKRLEKLNSLRN